MKESSVTRIRSDPVIARYLLFVLKYDSEATGNETLSPSEAFIL